MRIPYLNNKDISHTERIPQVVKEKPGFYKLIQLLGNYIDASTESIYTELSEAVEVDKITEETKPRHVQHLLNKVGTTITALPDSDSTPSISLQKAALQGTVLNRRFSGSKYSLKESLSNMFNVSGDNIEITDEGTMQISVSVKGIPSNISAEYIPLYIVPNITGVTCESSFETWQSFSTVEIANGTELQTASDNLSLCWMGVQGNKEVASNPPSDTTNYNNYTGLWALQVK